MHPSSWNLLMLRMESPLLRMSFLIINGIMVYGACRFTATDPKQVVDGKHYCQFGENHALCNRTFPWEDLINIADGTPDYRSSILTIHNNFRQSFAHGVWPNVNLPSAADMPLISWDEDLAKIAFALATRQEPTDGDRDSVETGKHRLFNIRNENYDSKSIEFYKAHPTDIHLQLTPKDIFTHWVKLVLFNQYGMTDLSRLVITNATWLPMVLMLRSDVTAMGCSWLKYCKRPLTSKPGEPPVYDENMKNAVEIMGLVCVYGTRNPINRTIYEEGTPCTKCKYGMNCHLQDYPDLCA